MATTFANGTLTIGRAMTATQATRLIDGVLGAEAITRLPDGTPITTNAQKMAAFDAWLWGYLKNDAVSYEARQAATTQTTTSTTELP